MKRSGCKPFFSEREIRGRTGVDYEAMILYALYTSETMLVVCRNEDYLQTPWVKNEFSRFKELVNNKEKENDSLTIVYNGTPIEKLSGYNGKIQGIDYSRREADFEIVKFVETHTPHARAKREEEKRKKNSEADLIRQQIEEQKRAQHELEERLRSLNPNTATGMTSTVGTLLTRANQEMEAKNFGKAQKFFETVLERAPENASAWWGLFLCEFKTTNGNTILEKLNKDIVETLNESSYLKNAIKYSADNNSLPIKFKNRAVEIISSMENEYKQKNAMLQKNLESARAEIKNGTTVCANFKKELKKVYYLPTFPLGKLFISFLVIGVICAIAWLAILITLSIKTNLLSNLGDEGVTVEILATAHIPYIIGWGYTISATEPSFGAVIESIAYGPLSSLVVNLVIGILYLPIYVIKKNRYQQYSQKVVALGNAETALNKLISKTDETSIDYENNIKIITILKDFLKKYGIS